MSYSNVPTSPYPLEVELKMPPCEGYHFPTFVRMNIFLDTVCTCGLFGAKISPKQMCFRLTFKIYLIIIPFRFGKRQYGWGISRNLSNEQASRNRECRLGKAVETGGRYLTRSNYFGFFSYLLCLSHISYQLLVLVLIFQGFQDSSISIFEASCILHRYKQRTGHVVSKEELDSGALKDKLNPTDYNVQGLVSSRSFFLPFRLPAVDQRVICSLTAQF